VAGCGRRVWARALAGGKANEVRRVARAGWWIRSVAGSGGGGGIEAQVKR